MFSRALPPFALVLPPPNSPEIRTCEKRASNPFRIRTCKSLDLKSFRIRTYRKTRGLGILLLTKLPVRIFLLSDRKEPRDGGLRERSERAAADDFEDRRHVLSGRQESKNEFKDKGKGGMR